MDSTDWQVRRFQSNRPSQTEYRKRAIQVRNGECGVRSAPQFDFRHRPASCASPCEIMPRAKASHCLRRISQGKPRAPLPLRHSDWQLPRSKAPEGWRTPRRFAFGGPLLISARFWTAVALHRFSHVRPFQNENRKRAVQVRNAPVFAPVFNALRRGELLRRGKECAPI